MIPESCASFSTATPNATNRWRAFANTAIALARIASSLLFDLDGCQGGEHQRPDGGLARRVDGLQAASLSKGSSPGRAPAESGGHANQTRRFCDPGLGIEASPLLEREQRRGLIQGGEVRFAGSNALNI